MSILTAEAAQSLVHPDLIPPEGCSVFNGNENLFIPNKIVGRRVLVLGCKTGLESYTLSALVGAKGHVVGIDDSAEDISEANRYVDYHTKQFGYNKPNIEFYSTPLEDLSVLGNDCVDLVVFASSINMHSRREQILKECYRVLRIGGEIYFSDAFCNKRITTTDERYATLYFEDFRRLMHRQKFLDVRTIEREDISEVFEGTLALGKGRITLTTVRAFKMPTLEDRLENYGQRAKYLGSQSTTPFHFDDRFIFPIGKWVPVDGNTADILATCYGSLFSVSPRGEHQGIFK